MSRTRLTWIVPGAVVAVGVFAALDAIRSSGGAPASTEANASEAVTTTQTDTDAELASFPELRTRRVVRLMPGRVSTHPDSSPVVTFMVPPGWYGYQDETGFVLGMGLVGEEVDLFPGGITVDVLDSTLAHAARTLEQVEGIRVKSPIRIGESPGRRYARRFGLHRDVTLEDLGLPGVVVGSRLGLVLLGAGGKTLVIRRHFTNDADRAEVNGVLSSFRLTTPKHAVERTGNRWARLFAAGRTCNRFMAQPACEWVVCERVGGRPIRKCTPVSSEVQRSFAGAVVEDVVIKGYPAAARFSNGEVVRFSGSGDDWAVLRVGAGHEFFE